MVVGATTLLQRHDCCCVFATPINFLVFGGDLSLVFRRSSVYSTSVVIDPAFYPPARAHAMVGQKKIKNPAAAGKTKSTCIPSYKSSDDKKRMCCSLSDNLFVSVHQPRCELQTPAAGPNIIPTRVTHPRRFSQQLAIYRQKNTRPCCECNRWMEQSCPSDEGRNKRKRNQKNEPAYTPGKRRTQSCTERRSLHKESPCRTMRHPQKN